MTHRSLLLVSTLLSFTASVTADHSEIVASGKPENVLAGINVYKTRPPEATRRLGKPHSIKDGPVEDAPEAVSRDYIWRADGCVLTAGTYNLRGEDGILYFASVAGCTKAPRDWRTGRGLQLGMTLPQLTAIYGSRFSGNATPDGSVDYEFRDGTTLSVELDSGLRISSIRLMAEIE